MKPHMIRTLLLSLLFALTFPSLAHGYYNPSTGRWLSRDPLGEKAGENLYGFVKNHSCDSFDRDGRIKVTVKEQKPTVCGSAEVYFDFKLDKAAAEDGYIIQENIADIPWTSCSGIVHGNIWTAHYWEAWFVHEGQDTVSTQAKDGYSDMVSWPGEPTRKGAGGIDGTIKFFFKSHNGVPNLGDPGADPRIPPDPASGWESGASSPSAGKLPSIRNDKPKWWDDPSDNGEQTATRSVKTDWKCCCEPKHSTINVTVTP